MKKQQWKPKRLLTPSEMEELVLAVIERDGTTCMGKRLKEEGHESWQDHVCGGRHTGPLTDAAVTEAAHQVPQTSIKAQYRKDPEQAELIAKIPDLCIPLCEILHSQEPLLSARRRFSLVAHNAEVLEAAALNTPIGGDAK